MVAMRVLLAISCLIATASCTLPVNSGGLLGVGKILPVGHHKTNQHFLGGLLGTIFGGISKTCNVTFNGIFQNIQVPKNLSDIFTLIRNLGIAVGKLLDKVIPGIGSPITHLFDVWAKILNCVLGLPCQLDKSLSCKGLEQYRYKTKSNNDWQLIFKNLGVLKIQAKIAKLIKLQRKNNSLKHLPISTRVSAISIQQFSRLLQIKHIAKPKLVFIKLLVRVCTQVAAIFNSHQYGSGDQFLTKFIPIINSILKKNKYHEITPYLPYMKNKVRRCHKDGEIWSEGNDYQNDQDDSSSETNESISNDDLPDNDSSSADDSHSQSDASQTDAPQTYAPQTDAPQTYAPQTDAPQTDAPQTVTPQTNRPHTKRPKHCTCVDD